MKEKIICKLVTEHSQNIVQNINESITKHIKNTHFKHNKYNIFCNSFVVVDHNRRHLAADTSLPRKTFVKHKLFLFIFLIMLKRKTIKNKKNKNLNLLLK